MPVKYYAVSPRCRWWYWHDPGKCWWYQLSVMGKYALRNLMVLACLGCAGGSAGPRWWHWWSWQAWAVLVVRVQVLDYVKLLEKLLCSKIACAAGYNKVPVLQAAERTQVTLVVNLMY